MTEPQSSRRGSQSGRSPFPMSNNPRPPFGPPNGTASTSASFSQSFRGSFNASQSVASTPNASSPPPPRGSQLSNASMSYGGNNNGMGYVSNSRGYAESGYGSMPQREAPQIYTAVYSNVSVYEMEVNGVAVMRRRSDSWLNATQILKVAGVVKARRTKTLEKEIAQGEHEKVQGGYGKYQGTWVNYQRGVELCRHYNVEEMLRPLLEYDMGQDGMGPGQGAVDTPTKEQAMAAQRKRMYHGLDGQGPSPQGTFFSNMSRSAVTAVNAISKARFESPVGRSYQSAPPRKSSQMSSQESHMPLASQQSMQSIAADSGFGSNAQSQRSMVDGGDEPLEPPRKRIRSSSHMNSFTANHNQSFMTEATPTEPSDSFYQPTAAQAAVIPDDPTRGIPPLPHENSPERENLIRYIMSLFLDKKAKAYTRHPALSLSAEELETPLDEHGNTALHWAAMLARLPLVHELVEKGCSIYRVNGAGESVLEKSVGTRNNYDYRSFSKLLQILAPTIEIVDGHGRTVLHHITMMAATGGCGHVAAKHYLEALLDFIVRFGGPAGGQQRPSPQEREVIGLGRFMSEMVNVRDEQGDTALNLAGRARTVLVPQLLEVGADPHLPNHTGLRPADYGVGVDMVNGETQEQLNAEGKDSFLSQLAKTKKEILESTVAQITAAVQQVLGEMDKELSASLTKKQEEFDQWQSKIRNCAKLRQIEQDRLDEIKRRSRERVELARRIKNLEQSSKELEENLPKLEVDESEGIDINEPLKLGDADRMDDFDVAKFRAVFDGSFDPTKGFSDEQKAFLKKLPPVAVLKSRIKAYEEHNASIQPEIDELKSKNIVLGENYRRMVMACTGWSAEKVDAAAEGLTACLKDLDENPLPEDVALEMLMRDRGQDW